MTKRELRDQFRLALGAMVVGGFAGAGGGAVLGTFLGLIFGSPERGLDGALMGALVAAGTGALAVCLLPPSDRHEPTSAIDHADRNETHLTARQS